MRIGFDGKRATMNFTGLGNYCRSVIIHLGKYFPENEFILFTPALKHPERYPELLQGKPFSFRFPKIILKKYLSWFWRSFLIQGILKKERIAIYHGLSGELPLGKKNKKTPFILTVHDLIFFRFPEYYKPMDRTIYKMKSRYSVKKADQIIAISDQTRKDLIEFLQVDTRKITVIYQACSDLFYHKLSVLELNLIREKYRLPKRFILYVGTLEARKRSLELLKAYSIFYKNWAYPIDLVLVGKKTPYFLNLENYIHENQLAEHVHFYHTVPSIELPGFYQMAEIFTYPSTFEGFGLPILEALVSGVPVISSLGSCFSEAGGKGSLYLDPENSLVFAEKIKEVLDSPERQKQMIQEGYEHSKRFEPSVLAKELMEVYTSFQRI